MVFVENKRSEFLTWPNLFTLFRFVCIPLFVWMLFVQEDRFSAALLLAVLGSTDWFDGWLARVLNQSSRFGAIFDPVVDRLLFVVAVPSLIIDGSIPLVVAILALVREVSVALIAVFSYLQSRKILKVTWEGKSGAFALMFAFPMFLFSASDRFLSDFFYYLAWFISIPGLLFAFYSLFFQYLKDAYKDVKGI